MTARDAAGSRSNRQTTTAAGTTSDPRRDWRARPPRRRTGQWITKISGEKKGHVIFSSKEAPNLILDVLAVSNKTVKTKSAETKAFLKALNRGYDFV
jgi:hypothetical protein